MNLGYELSKFKRNDVAIVDFISMVLGERLEPLVSYVNNTADESLKLAIKSAQIPSGFESNEFSNIYIANFEDFEVMIYLPLSAEVFIDFIQESVSFGIDNRDVRGIHPYFIEESYSSESKFNYSTDNRHFSIFKEFIKKEDAVSRYVIMFDYDSFYVQTNFASINYGYEHFHNIKRFLKDGYDKDMAFVFQHIVKYLPLSDYILDKDSYIKALRDSLVDGISDCSNQDIKNDYISALDKFDTFLRNHDSKDFDNQFIKYSCGSTSTLFLWNSFGVRKSHLINWGKLLVLDSDVVSISYHYMFPPEYDLLGHSGNRSIMPIITINIVKDLPKLLWQVYNSRFCGKPSQISALVPGYFSTDAHDFRKPYDIHDGLLFADGNLSKSRAVKKFIEAVKTLGLNLSEFVVNIRG